MERKENKRVSLGPNIRQSISILERSNVNDDSLLQSNRRSSFAIPQPRQSIRKSIVPQKKQLTNDEIKKMYAECYLLCDQKKVTEKNVWALKLIDNLKDVIKVDSDENKGAANFVKAGFAIDAGVQIYSIRVDSVHKNTFQVVDSIKNAGLNEIEDEELSSFDETNEKLIEENSVETQKESKKKERSKKKRVQTTQTIEKNVKKLLTKTEELKYHKDKLFHQRISALEGKSILQDVVHNYGDFISGDYGEIIDINEEENDQNCEDPIIEWEMNDISELNITEINTQNRNDMINDIMYDLQTPMTTQAMKNREEEAERIFDDLPVENDFDNYVDDLNPVDDEGGEMLPNTNNIQHDLLAPIVTRTGFTYFDPNLYNIKDIQSKLKKEFKEGKFMKPKENEKKHREKKEVQNTFDLTNKKVVEFKTYFTKKATTKTLIPLSDDKRRSNFNEVDVSNYSHLMLVPTKRLGMDDDNLMNDDDQNNNLFMSRFSLANGMRQTLIGGRPSIMNKEKNENEEDEDERMFIRSDDEEEHKETKETGTDVAKKPFNQIVVPRMINVEKITAATKPKNLDYDGCEVILMKTLNSFVEETGRKVIEFQELLDRIGQNCDKNAKKDLTVHFIFVSLNILCFKKGYRIEKDEHDNVFLNME